jgi:hypothetical protein
VISEKKYRKIDKAIKVLQKKESESLGAMRQLEKELKKEFGVKSVEEAKKRLKKMKKEQKKSEDKFNKEFVKFAKQFGKLLRAMEEGDPKIHRVAKIVLKEAKRGKKSSKKDKKRAK